MVDFVKHPNDKNDYAIEWSDWLASGDSISTATWAVPSGLTEVTSSISGTKTLITLSGGTDGQYYTVPCAIVTAAGLEETRQITLYLTTASFTYALNATQGQVRLEIGDTNPLTDQGMKPDGTNFTDAELLYMYAAEHSSVPAAAARACEILARMWAGAGQNVKIRDYQINSQEKAKYYRDLAKDLREQTGTRFAGGAAPTTRVDGYSTDVNSQEVEVGGSSGYWRERVKVIRWP